MPAALLALRRPGEDAVRAFLAASEGERLSYDCLGATRAGGAPPRGYDVDRNRVRVGAGEAVFARAADALRRWTQFRLGWVEVRPPGAPVREGTTVAVLVRAAGAWWLNASRIVYVEEEATGPVRRFAFAYGTLPAHVERGEERFSVEWRAGGDGTVWYEIHAFSQPRHPLARLGYPLARLWQRRFVRDSMRVMVEAAATA